MKYIGHYLIELKEISDRMWESESMDLEEVKEYLTKVKKIESEVILVDTEIFLLNIHSNELREKFLEKTYNQLIYEKEIISDLEDFLVVEMQFNERIEDDFKVGFLGLFHTIVGIYNHLVIGMEKITNNYVSHTEINNFKDRLLQVKTNKSLRWEGLYSLANRQETLNENIGVQEDIEINRLVHKEQIVLLNELGFFELDKVKNLTPPVKGKLVGKLLNRSVKNSELCIGAMNPSKPMNSENNPYRIPKYLEGIKSFFAEVGIKGKKNSGIKQ